MLVLGFQEFVGQPGGGVETHPFAQLTGQQSQGNGGVGLASAHVANQHDILVFRQVISLGQFQHAGFVYLLDDVLGGEFVFWTGDNRVTYALALA